MKSLYGSPSSRLTSSRGGPTLAVFEGYVKAANEIRAVFEFTVTLCSTLLYLPLLIICNRTKCSIPLSKIGFHIIRILYQPHQLHLWCLVACWHASRTRFIPVATYITILCAKKCRSAGSSTNWRCSCVACLQAEQVLCLLQHMASSHLTKERKIRIAAPKRLMRSSYNSWWLFTRTSSWSPKLITKACGIGLTCIHSPCLSRTSRPPTWSCNNRVIVVGSECGRAPKAYCGSGHGG